MGRSHVPPGAATAATGRRWTAFRKALFKRWGPAPACYLCGHMGSSEVQHLVSPLLEPDLRWLTSNCRPCHGGGRKRCAECHIACNIAAASNAAPRNQFGESLPFTPEFMARQEAMQRQNMAKYGQVSKPYGGKAAPAAGREERPSNTRSQDAGREW